MDSQTICSTDYRKEQAIQANQAFDDAVRHYLRDWIDRGTNTDAIRTVDGEHDTEAFIEQGALRSFFKHREDAFEQLLNNDTIASHLLRSSDQVYFQQDAYQPLLAKFEQRIYNLAAHREHLEVPFRYSSASRQGDHGDSVTLADMPTDQIREDIGLYFGTRRSDTTALNILARQLRREALGATELPIHVITEGYMLDSLRAVRTATELFGEQGDTRLHCFVIQRRHAADDRHLGAALLLMNPEQPESPRRIIFCDTLNPSGQQPPWWHTFRRNLDAAFPQPAEQLPTAARLEDGGVNLQRLHDGVPVRHQDIDCAFYTASIGRALIHIARTDPALLINGSIDEIVSQMTGSMTEYFVRANQPRDPAEVREVNVIRRWNTGRQAIKHIRESLKELTYSISATAIG